MHADTLVNVALFLVMPFFAVVLLLLVVFLAIRGGKPFKFQASGFGVSIGFSTDDDDDACAHKDEHE